MTATSQLEVRPKVLWIYHHPIIDSTAKLLDEIALDGRVELSAVTPDRQQTMENADERVLYKRYFVPLAPERNYYRFFATLPLLRVLREVKPDIVLAFTEAYDGYLLQMAWMRKFGLIHASLLFYAFENLPLSQGKRFKLLIAPAWPAIGGGASANTEAIGNLRAAGISEDRPIAFVPYAISPEGFEPRDPSERLAINQENAPFVVGFVGRIVESKGIADMIDALVLLPETVSFTLVGEGAQMDELRAKAREQGVGQRVQWLGPVPTSRIPSVMRTFDALVLPSRTTKHWKEQFGRVLVEAMLAGVPVIGSDSGAIPEVIGDFGLIVPERSPVELAAAIRSLATNPELWASLSQRGLSRAREQFTPNIMAKRLVDLAVEVAQKKRRS